MKFTQLSKKWQEKILEGVKNITSNISDIASIDLLAGQSYRRSSISQIKRYETIAHLSGYGVIAQVFFNGDCKSIKVVLVERTRPISQPKDF